MLSVGSLCFNMDLESLGSTVVRLLRDLLVVPPLLVLCTWCWYQWRFRRVLAAARKLPTGLPVLPLLGHSYLMYQGIEGMSRKCVEVVQACAAKGSKALCMWLGPHPIMCFFGAKDVHTLMTSPKTSEKAVEYKYLKLFLGNGLISAPGNIHKITRTHMNMLFNMSNLKHLMPVFNQSSRELVKDLASHVGRDSIDLLDPVNIVALRNIACVMFGPDVKIDTDSEEFRGMLTYSSCVKYAWLHRLIKFWLWSDTMFKLFWKSVIKEMDECWKRFCEGPLQELKNKKWSSQMDNSKVKKSKDVEDGDHVPLTMPAVYWGMRQNYPQFTDQDLHFEMRTLLLAGSDTSRIGISSLLLSVAALPEVQERVYEEIMTVVGSDKDVTVQDIQHMPYLDQVYKETLRRYSVVGATVRRVDEDIQLSTCMVPAGASVGVCYFGLHFDSEVFPDPEAFDPERFSIENAAKIHRWAFLPFSGGPRNCIGGQYAALLMKTVAVHVLRRYLLTTSMDIRKLQFKADLALESVDGYLVQLFKRNNVQ